MSDVIARIDTSSPSDLRARVIFVIGARGPRGTHAAKGVIEPDHGEHDSPTPKHDNVLHPLSNKRTLRRSP
jgi:hypothetical protein